MAIMPTSTAPVTTYISRVPENHEPILIATLAWGEGGGGDEGIAEGEGGEVGAEVGAEVGG